MLYIHKDKHYWDHWYPRFAHHAAKAGIPYRTVDLLRSDYRDLPIGPNDGLIGRFGHRPRELRQMRPIFAALDEYCGGRIFPRYHAFSYYDDKRRQMELLQTKGYPAPRTAFVESREDVERFLDESGLRFPLVAKRTYGASSSQVRLIHSVGEVPLPGILQEFCGNNDGDMRVVVIGNRVMGFCRKNRRGDFRASGSGLKVYLEDLDFECVQLAYRISAENGFESMSYDLVRDNEGRWVVLEFSYNYGPGSRKCRYYYEMPNGEKKDKTGVYPEDFILADFIGKHPELASGGITEPRGRTSVLSLFKNGWSFFCNRSRQPRGADRTQ